ncbi:prephenate dehydratase [Candidatus Peregrinibacteria bacterium]|nr:prephenate dehydratase [Candidatus Peregrinibacteria bacterium]
MKNPLIGIIGGKGRMGQLFADFFRQRGLEVLVSDMKTSLSNQALAKQVDIVIVSVPIDKTEATINEVMPFIKANAAIMDFTSVKEMPVRAMLSGNCEVLGLHPMFGNSNPIPGQTIILTPTKSSKKHSKWMEQFLKKSDVKIIKMTPEEHDKTMSIAQDLIHFAEITFADALRRTKVPIKEIFRYTSPASELKVQLAARLIDQDAGLYGNMQIFNPNAVHMLSQYQEAVKDYLEVIKKKDLKAFKLLFEKDKKYLGNYTKEAYKDSSYLIDKHLHNKRPIPKLKTIKPGQRHLAILGPANTNTDIAGGLYLKDQKLEKYYAKDIDEVFELVSGGRVKEGIIPIENKLEGTVRESLDGLFYNNVHIAKELNIPIHHCLITMAHAKASDIKRIRSHSQALHQCRNYLKKNFQNAERESFASTAAAVEKLLKNSDVETAVIAPEQAAKDPNLKIIARNIGDEADNSTTFIIIRKGPAKTSGPKTSIAFHFSKDSPGSLFSVFKDFADAKINMTKIESRPTKAHFGDYIFYMDFEGDISNPKIKKVLVALESKVAKLKILGSY